MTMTNEQARKIFDAFQAGEDWAKSLKIGDVFRGSHGEADHRGLVDAERRCFGSGALGVISSFKRLYLNADLTIADNSVL
jgi:hypothetical protein